MIMCICSMFYLQVRAESVDRNAGVTLRVAFYPLEGFFEYDEDGKEAGYGVELLDKISQYTGMKFEYVRASSWEETKRMLVDGKADLRMPGTKPPTPSDTLVYNDTSIMATYDALLTKNSRDDLYYQDYDKIRTLKIAVSESFYEMDEVQKYLDTVDISLDQIIFCSEYNEAEKMLISGQADALISNIMDMNSDMKLLARFGNAYNYFSMLIGRPEIRELDNALTEIALDEPGYLTTLYSRWYPKRTTVPNTLEETQYLNSVDHITFAFRSNEGYLSRCENGEFYGIYVEMAREICRNLGVEFRAADIDECLAGKDEADVYAGFFFDQNYAEEWNFSITAPINDINYYAIKKREKSFDEKTCRIAVMDKFRYTKEYIYKFYPDAKYVYCDSYEDCLKAVAAGRADMSIINNYIAEYYLNLYQFSDLSASLSGEYSHLYCFAAADHNDVLASLLTKGIHGISVDEMTQIYIRGQEKKPETNFWMAMVYSSPITVACGLFIFLALIFAVVFLFLISGRRRTQNMALTAALSAKSDFLSRMSHDMRTPMNGILGLTTLLMDHDMPEDVREGMAQIQMSGEYLLDLINDTLDMSKIESGHIELHPVPTDVQEITKNTISNARLMADQKGVNLSVGMIQPEKITPVNVMIDRSRVEQIFMNLISNAVKFTPVGGNVYISIERMETADDYIVSRYVVQDTGIGMSKEFLTHLYEPFSQEGRMHTERESGTGLGLSIVKRVVDLMGGDLQVESHMGEGTKFTLVLRFERYHGDITGPSHEPLDEAMLKGRRILVCEDHPLNRQIAQKLLEKKGMVVDCAEDGQLGVDRFRDSDIGCYDAVLMDLRMPVMDGYAATRAIRSLKRKDASVVPIIAMTANAFDEDVKKCLDAGMNAHIAKPIDVELLYRTLAEYIGKRRK